MKKKELGQFDFNNTDSLKNKMNTHKMKKHKPLLQQYMKANKTPNIAEEFFLIKGHTFAETLEAIQVLHLFITKQITHEECETYFIILKYMPK